jgi:RNA polymerase sigma-70 factor, ECF subfamily
VTAPSQPASRQLLDLYDDALPQVYGYLLARCGQPNLAEDLTAETFLAAVDAVRRPHPPTLHRGWLIGVARHKLVDHWRRVGRETAHLRSLPEPADAADPAEHGLDTLLARQTLARLAPQHRMVLTLRYVDDLPVREVAALIRRTEHATEGLLVRARRAFRAAYPEDRGGERDD